jgi:hypothetical protein
VQAFVRIWQQLSLKMPSLHKNKDDIPYVLLIVCLQIRWLPLHNNGQ